MRTVLERAGALNDEKHVFAIAVQAWAESIRSPALADLLHGIYRDALAKVEVLLDGYRADGLIRDDVPTRQQAAVIMTMVQGFITHHVMFGELDAGGFQAGLASLLPRA